MPSGAGMCDQNSLNEKEGSTLEEQPQERRSSRLRSRKPGKEESDFSTNKDLSKIVQQFLLPYLVDGTGYMNCKHNSIPSSHSADAMADSSDSETTDVIEFIQSTSNNYSAYHTGHLLLEKIANRSILYNDGIAKILDLEKVTRHWGKERTPECSLFLAELYYDLGLRSFETYTTCSSMSEASYHLCKIIESVALEHPFNINGMDGLIDRAMSNPYEHKQQLPVENLSLLRSNHCFWVRFFWLSARLSLLEGDKEKSQKELSIVLALFLDGRKMDITLGPICLPHCKVVKKLTVDMVLHEANMIEVDYLLKTSANEMLEKGMHAECISMLAPLLLLEKEVHFDQLYDLDTEGKGNNSVELSALDVLIKSCELAEPLNMDVYLNCHKRKFQILLAGADLACNSPDNAPGLSTFLFSNNQSKENLWKHWIHLVAEEVKAVSQSASRIKNIISQNENSGNIPMAIIGDIQSLLVIAMSNIANLYFGKKSSGFGAPESTEKNEQCYFVDASIAFCKLQQLNCDLPIKFQAELVVAIHDMPAEFGICCSQGNGEEQDGTFLKLAIRHLLVLDMKLKSNVNSLNTGQETKFDQTYKSDHSKTPEPIPGSIRFTESQNKSHSVDVGKIDEDVSNFSEKDTADIRSVNNISSRLDLEKPGDKCDYQTQNMCSNGDMENNQIIEGGNELTEDEREELELISDNALDQCFYCLHGLNLKSNSSCNEDLVKHKNTSQGDYQTKEQCADVFQYILPSAKASSRTGLVKLRRVLRAIRKHFPQPPEWKAISCCVDLQTDELWSSAFEDTDHLKTLETKWNPPLSEIKNVIVKGVADEDLETASTLLRSSYNFYKDTSCALLPSGINLYMVPAQLATETCIQPGIDGLDILDMNTSRKLLLWAYSLSHGHCINVSHVIKYCEENAKSRIKKGLGGSSTPVTPSQPAIASPAGGAKDGIGKTIEPETHTSLPETPSSHKLAAFTSPEIEKTGKEASTSPESRTGDSSARTEEKHAIATDSETTTGNKPNMPPASSPSRDAKSN